jgi:MFS family permease
MANLRVLAPAVHARRRSTGALIVGVAFMNIAMVSSSTVATLIASDSAGRAWSGLPSAAGVLGTAFGTLLLSALMRDRGRRTGVLLGYSVAMLGAAVAAVAALGGGVALLVAGIVLLGVGNGSAQLSRYAAADLYPADRKGFVLSLVVWGGTIGAVVGPGLIAPAAEFSDHVGLPSYAGSYLLAVVVTGVAAAANLLLPRSRSAMSRRHTRFISREAGAAFRLPAARIALAGMVSAQLAMVAVMTMTPLQLHEHGHGLDVVGWVLTAHLVGMFALSPLSGRLADRCGGRTTISCGAGVLIASAALAIAAPTSHRVGLPLALFLLGYGWNLCFVGGSSLLSRDLPEDLRTELQGLVDALVWGTSAFASLSAGAIFAGAGYSMLALMAGVLAVMPLVVLAVLRRDQSAARVGESLTRDRKPPPPAG